MTNKKHTEMKKQNYLKTMMFNYQIISVKATNCIHTNIDVYV